MHNNGLSAAGRGTTESLVERDACVRREAGDERSDWQDAGIRRVDEIKAKASFLSIFAKAK